MIQSSSSTVPGSDGEELSEIRSLLPPSHEGEVVVQLGMDSDDFAHSIMKSKVQEVGVDHNGNIIAKNKERSSILEVVSGSADLVFSTWLFSLVPDDEVSKVVESMMKWLKPDGHVFIRETCYCLTEAQKRERKEKKGHRLLRQPSEYASTFQQTHTTEDDRSYKFELVVLKNLGVYVRNKLERKHEVCWLWKKAIVPPIAPDQKVVDTQQNERSEIVCKQHIFGDGRVSPGGMDTIKEFVNMLDLKPDQRVLDVGCGIGGDDFYMAENFGAEVVGIDKSVDMITVALERSTGNVEFALADCTKVDFPDASFDVIYSRDTILHIQDKPTLFSRFFKWLKADGRVLISDCCLSPSTPSEEFAQYIKQRGYDLHSVQAYGQMLQAAGFIIAIAEDRTDRFVEVLKKELAAFEQGRAQFSEVHPSKPSFFPAGLNQRQYMQEDCNRIVREWESTLKRKDEQKWGLFVVHKPSVKDLLKSVTESLVNVNITQTPVPKKSYKDAVKSIPPNVSKTKPGERSASRSAP